MTTITRALLATLTPDEAAALWIVQQDQDALVEAGLFDGWFDQSEENRQAWHDAQRAWSLFDDADDPAFDDVRQRALADVPAHGTQGLASHWRQIAAAAALLAMTVGGAHWYQGSSDRLGQLAAVKAAKPVQRIYTASAGATAKFVLADGTDMTLGKGAQVGVAMAGDRRQIVLQRGGAEFSVRHDASRPFVVSAQDRTVTDIGTLFNVMLEEDGLRVALYEGEVRVDGAGKEAIALSPGQQLIARKGKPDLIVPVGSNKPAGGDLVQFDDVTLATAARTINEGSAITLTIPDPTIARLRVSGRFRARDPERFARSAAQLLSLRVVHVGRNTVELRGRR